MTPAEARALRWLAACVPLVGVYALALVAAGPVLAEGFDLLGFGAAEAGITDGPGRDYVLFLQGVLGAVIVGWTLLLHAVVRGPLRRREPWAWNAVAGSLLGWFVLDTGFSLAVGQVTHAVFNLAFVVVLGAPLLVLRRPGLLLPSNPDGGRPQPAPGWRHDVDP